MIRPAELKDCQTIANIYNQHIEKGNASMDAIKSAEDIEQWLKSYINREGIFMFEDEQQIKGWGVIKKYSDRCGYRFACETSIYIDDNFRRQGIGHQLNTFLIDKAKAYDYKHLTAKIFADNIASINFFKNYGYTIVGKQHKIGYVNDKWIDMVIMEKVL